MHDKIFLQNLDKNIKEKFFYLPSVLKQMRVKTIHNLLIIDSGLPSNMFNIICCNGKVECASVQLAIDHFRSKKLPYSFWIGFEEEPYWLEKQLLALDLITEETEWAMVCNLEEQKLPALDFHFTIRPLQNFSDLQDVISIINIISPNDEHLAIESFYQQSAPVLLSESCSLKFFIGYEKEKPVSLCSLFCNKEIASIFDVIVLPEMRGRGLGKAMTVKAMLEAQKKGFEKCILTATNEAKYLYQKLGFTVLKKMKVYQDSLKIVE